MKITYIANVRMPTEKAHGVQIMKMCEAWGKNHEVTLFVPTRFNHIKINPFEYYSVHKNFVIKKILSIDFLPFGKIFGRTAFWVQNISFAVFASFATLFKKSDIIFSRDFWSAFFISWRGKKVVYEIHDSPNRHFITRYAFKKIDKFVVTNNYKAEELKKDFDMLKEKILVVPNGVDIGFFEAVESKDFSRHLVGLPRDGKIILYSGHLYSWKGADILLEAAKKMSKNVITVFVGGIAQDIERFKTMASGYDNILILGHQEYKKIPYYLSSADVFVLPNTAKELISLKETSPIKLFEYMAAGRPIIASDIPSIREIVSEKEVVFFHPDDSGDLAEKITLVLSEYDKYLKMAEEAKKIVYQYSWSGRAEKIINFTANHEL